MYRLGRMERILAEAKSSSGLFGADDEDQDDQLQGGEESEEDENDSDEQDENDEQDDSQDDDPTAGLKAKNSQLILAKKDLKQKLREANDKIQKLEAGSDQDDDEEKESDKRDQTISAQSETIRSLQLQVAFLSDNTHSWNDPKLAISLIDMDDLDVEEDGSISGLKEALDDLAKSRPYLVKTPEKQQRRKSGDQQQRKSDSATKAAHRSKLRSKYNI